MGEERLLAVGGDVRADAIGLNRSEIAALHYAVGRMLAGGETPLAPFDCYSHFDGACDHTGRHRCVLLPIEAVLIAFDAEAEGA